MKGSRLPWQVLECVEVFRLFYYRLEIAVDKRMYKVSTPDVLPAYAFVAEESECVSDRGRARSG